MIDFIDKTNQTAGTPINRVNMMALQGFVATRTTFNADGSIVETNSRGETKTTLFASDGSIWESFVGEKPITKITRFLSDGSIQETIV